MGTDWHVNSTIFGSDSNAGVYFVIVYTVIHALGGKLTMYDSNLGIIVQWFSPDSLLLLMN